MAALHSDPALIEPDDAQIETLPINEVKNRLRKWGLSPHMRSDLKRLIAKHTSPATTLLSVLDDPECFEEPGQPAGNSIEKMPLAHVQAHLQQLGIRSDEGLARVSAIVQRHAHDARPVGKAVPGFAVRAALAASVLLTIGCLSWWRLTDDPEVALLKTHQLEKIARYGDAATDELIIRKLRPEAEKNSSKAQFGLGLEYATARGGLRNYKETMNWWTRAAELGNPEASEGLTLAEAFEEQKPLPNTWVRLMESFNEDKASLKDLSAETIALKVGDLARAAFAPDITISGPNAITFIGSEGGPFEPSSLSVDATDTGRGAHWSAAVKGIDWLDVSPREGDLLANETTHVTLSLADSAKLLRPGTTSEGSITFMSGDGTEIKRTVRLVVTDAPNPIPRLKGPSLGSTENPDYLTVLAELQDFAKRNANTLYAEMANNRLSIIRPDQNQPILGPGSNGRPNYFEIVEEPSCAVAASFYRLPNRDDERKDQLNDNKTVRLWSLPKGLPLGTISNVRVAHRASDIALSTDFIAIKPAGSQLIENGDVKTATQIYDVRTGSLMQSIISHNPAGFPAKKKQVGLRLDARELFLLPSEKREREPFRLLSASVRLDFSSSSLELSEDGKLLLEVHYGGIVESIDDLDEATARMIESDRLRLYGVGELRVFDLLTGAREENAKVIAKSSTRHCVPTEAELGFRDVRR